MVCLDEKLMHDSPRAARFWQKMGGQLGRKFCCWLKMLFAIPILGFIIHVFAFETLLHQSTIMHTCYLGQSNHQIVRLGPNFGLGLAVLKQCVWMKTSCTHPIPGFLNLAHEPILTLEYFYSNLQPFAHVIWAKSVLELLAFGPNWGSA